MSVALDLARWASHRAKASRTLVWKRIWLTVSRHLLNLDLLLNGLPLLSNDEVARRPAETQSKLFVYGSAKNPKERLLALSTIFEEHFAAEDWVLLGEAQLPEVTDVVRDIATKGYSFFKVDSEQ